MKFFANSPLDSQSITFGGLNHLKNSRNNGMWIGSLNGGLCFFDLNTELAINYLNDPANPGSLANNQMVVPFEDPEGNLWAGSFDFTLSWLPPGGPEFCHFRPDLPEEFQLINSEPGALGEIIQDTRDPDLIWLGSKYGLFSFRKSTQTFAFHPFERQIRFWYRDYAIQLLMTPDHRIWVGGADTGLLQFDPETLTWRSWRNHEALTNPSVSINTISNIIQAGKDWLLATTNRGDLWWLNRKTGSLEIEKPYPANVNAGPAIYSALECSNGDILLGRGNDLLRLTQKPPAFPFVYLPGKNPLLRNNNWQRATLLSKNRKQLYIGTLHGNGLLIWDLEKDQIKAIKYREHSLEADVFMDDLCWDDSDCLWIGSENGMLYLNPGANKIYPGAVCYPPLHRLANTHISAVNAAGDQLWIGTLHSGLYCLETITGALEKTTDPVLAEAAISKIAPGPDGNIWIGHNQGLSYYEPAGKKFTHFGRNKKQKPGLSHVQVTDFEWDNHGGLWIATLGGGLNYLVKDQNGAFSFRYFINDGAPGGNNFYQVEFHPNGRIWLGADSGLAVLDPKNGIFTNFDTRDGLFAKIGALQVLPDGKIMSGGNIGFHLFHPDTLFNSETAPEPYIKSFKVFDRELPLKEQIILAPGQNHFSLELGALNFNINARNSYSYQLSGYDRNWVHSGERDYVAYTNLPPGSYQFRMKAATRHNFSTDREVSLQIRIRPHFWQTLWFQMMIATGLAAAAWGIGTYRSFKRREEQARQIIDYYAHSTHDFSTEDDILWDLAGNCLSRLDFEDCVIYLVDEQRQVLVQKAALGPKSPKPNEISDPLEIPVGKGIVGAVAQSGKGEIITDVRKDPRYISDNFEGRSEIAIPILHDEKVIGIIDAEHSDPGFFKPFHFRLLTTVAAFCANKMVKARAEAAIVEKEMQLLELDKHLAETQLIALRAQMNPHFLFNCMNSINWYIVKNKPREASRYLTKFSRLIRLILDHSKARQISLEKELEALKLYIEIEAMRFDEKFSFILEVDERLNQEEVMIPPLIFQPYVENAIWHGLMQSARPGVLSIRLFPSGQYLECIIEDNGIGRQAAKTLQEKSLSTKSSEGMSITARRILLHRQESGSETPVDIIDLFDEPGQPSGTRVILNLPL